MLLDIYQINNIRFFNFSEKWVDILSSDEFQKYFQEMKEATTDEKYRDTDKWNEEYMGMPGTFRTLNLD